MMHVRLRTEFGSIRAATNTGMHQVSAETVERFGTACKDEQLTRPASPREFSFRVNLHDRVGGRCLASAQKAPPRLAECERPWLSSS